MAQNPWIAALFALFAWWFSTGLILVVVARADRRRNAESAHLRMTLFTLPLLALGWFGFVETMGATDLASIYGAFLSALLIWGWFELAFLCGVLTGPNRRPCPPGAPEWERFLRAWGTIAYSEMALIATMIAVAALGAGAPNGVGVWTFGLLFAARISAKLNLYLGVRQVNEAFLPQPMRHLPSHFRSAPMNPLFPLSVTALTLATAYWLHQIAGAAPEAPMAAGYALLAALTALALVEHWAMILPVADAKLWSWLSPDLTASERAASAASAPARERAAAPQSLFETLNNNSDQWRGSPPSPGSRSDTRREMTHGL
ncbi:MAG: putative photosynthetic complex assembly protein PuhE [Pseudomonadota bacterium]